MRVLVPTIRGPEFMGMTVCGHLTDSQPSSRKPVDHLGQPPPQAAIVDAREIPFVLGLCLTEHAKQHVHVDFVAVKEYADAKSLPELVAVDSILSQLERFAGQEIFATFFGRFRLCLDIIPDDGLVKRTQLTFATGGLSISSREIAFGIDGALPVETIRWKAEGTKNLVVEIGGATVTKIDENYLTNIYECIESVLEVLVLFGKQ